MVILSFFITKLNYLGNYHGTAEKYNDLIDNSRSIIVTRMTIVIFYNTDHRSRIHITKQLTNGPSKLECLSLASLSGLTKCNIVVHWAYSEVTKKISVLNTAPDSYL